ncbi:uncharacterized protein I303_105006 [Kwoniella dejecticola CBS 10117]|uniref:Uncharacterized protein n=1 Tax=Kwoniella dejecticola CBS 10117 TaxID=1296121 RepID=A0A1A6A3Q1_9TREE|nr:uncharacterized protein I303_05549 [Kwoniella dejecticola CBS 10117]OBR84690.1 hypothetical protein I303_05549 [Kwoniella dejecticola CBS 10117]
MSDTDRDAFSAYASTTDMKGQEGQEGQKAQNSPIEQLVQLTGELEMAAYDDYNDKDEYAARLVTTGGYTEADFDTLKYTNPEYEADYIVNVLDMREAEARAEEAGAILEEKKAIMKALLDTIIRSEEGRPMMGSDEFKAALKLLKEIREGTWKPEGWEEEYGDSYREGDDLHAYEDGEYIY